MPVEGTMNVIIATDPIEDVVVTSFDIYGRYYLHHMCEPQLK